jgi:hypothetical protein
MTESSSTNARLWVERDGDGAFAATVVTDGTVRLATSSLASVVPGGPSTGDPLYERLATVDETVAGRLRTAAVDGRIHEGTLTASGSTTGSSRNNSPASPTSVPTAAGPASNSSAALTVVPVRSCGRSGRTHPPFGTGRH